MKFFILLLGLLFLQSCDNQKVDFFQLDENGELSEYQSQLIVESEEFQSYFNLRISFLDNVKDALKKRYSIDELTEISMKALNGEEENRFYEAIFSGFTKGQSYVNELKEAQKAVYEKFPILNFIEIDGDPQISREYINNLYVSIDKNWRSVKVQVRNSSSGNEIPVSEIVCGSYWQQVKLAACAAACSFATAGVGTPLCGWACWCMLCTKNSDVYDTIC